MVKKYNGHYCAIWKLSIMFSKHAIEGFGNLKGRYDKIKLGPTNLLAGKASANCREKTYLSVGILRSVSGACFQTIQRRYTML